MIGWRGGSGLDRVGRMGGPSPGHGNGFGHGYGPHGSGASLVGDLQKYIANLEAKCEARGAEVERLTALTAQFEKVQRQTESALRRQEALRARREESANAAAMQQTSPMGAGGGSAVVLPGVGGGSPASRGGGGGGAPRVLYDEMPPQVQQLVSDVRVLKDRMRKARAEKMAQEETIRRQNKQLLSFEAVAKDYERKLRDARLHPVDVEEAARLRQEAEEARGEKEAAEKNLAVVSHSKAADAKRLRGELRAKDRELEALEAQVASLRDVVEARDRELRESRLDVTLLKQKVRDLKMRLAMALPHEGSPASPATSGGAAPTLAVTSAPAPGGRRPGQRQQLGDNSRTFLTSLPGERGPGGTPRSHGARTSSTARILEGGDDEEEDAMAALEAEAEAEERDIAARRIQAVQRGRAARRELREQHLAAAHIQDCYRGRMAGKREEEQARRRAEARKQDYAATRIQAVHRGRAARREVLALRESKAVAAEAEAAAGAEAAASSTNGPPVVATTELIRDEEVVDAGEDWRSRPSREDSFLVHEQEAMAEEEADGEANGIREGVPEEEEKEEGGGTR